MDGVYELRNEISSLKSMFNNSISNRTLTEKQITTDTLNNNFLETKFFFPKRKTHFCNRKCRIQDKIDKLLRINTP